MAEAFLNHHGNGRFEAHSAGLEPSSIHPVTMQVMMERGLDLKALGHRSKGIWDEFISKHVMVGYLVTVCDRAEARCPIYPGPHIREYWDIKDPAEATGSDAFILESFRDARDLIEERVLRFLAEHGEE
jgi:arsenate reductase